MNRVLLLAVLANPALPPDEPLPDPTDIHRFPPGAIIDQVESQIKVEKEQFWRRAAKHREGEEEAVWAEWAYLEHCERVWARLWLARRAADLGTADPAQHLGRVRSYVGYRAYYSGTLPRP